MVNPPAGRGENNLESLLTVKMLPQALNTAPAEETAMSRKKQSLPISIVYILICIFLVGLLWASVWGDPNDHGWHRDAGDLALTLRRIAGSGEEHFADQKEPDGVFLTVHFIDVGQGDAVLVRTPQGKVVLIDGGTRVGGEAVLAYLEQLGISKIDLVIGTHPHEDHIGGLVGVLEKLPVGKVIDSGKNHTSQTYDKYLTLIDQKKIPFEIGRAGKTIDLDPSITLQILHPGPDIENSNLNHSSVVVQLCYGQASFLFTGDAETEAEAEILERGYHRTAVNILKVGHHGSSNATSEEFLKAVAPDVAVISSGPENLYGHPHEETLSRLAAAGAKIYRTDLAGSIVITTDGSGYTVDIASGLSSGGLPANTKQG